MSDPRFAVFRYREEEPRRDGPPISRPTLDLTLAAERQVTVRALVDTGAPWCVFDNSIGLALDVDMTGPPSLARGDRQISMLGGAPWVRFQEVGLELPAPFRGQSWTAEVGFLLGSDLNVSFAGVLGHVGFLDRWVVTFNYIDSYFVVEEHSALLDRLDFDPYEVVQQQYDDDWQRPTTM